MVFHFNIWLSYFFFYCICGWIFESTYVSLADRRLTNRGFMKGPWLPIYGSGAVVILIVTLPFQDNPVVVYIVGALAATVLEYVTGVMMVKLFKVRYWDYSYRKIQFQGHICLVSTIAWGFLSLLMVYVVHPPVQRLLSYMNDNVLDIVTNIITICMVYDFANAFRHAMDLRALIEEAQELQKRMQEVVAQKKERINELAAEGRDKITGIAAEGRERIHENSIEARGYLEHRRSELEKALEDLRQRMEKYSGQLLLHNRGAYAGMEEESSEIKRRILVHRSMKK